MENDFLTVGRVLAPWGLKGDAKVEIHTDFPQRFAPSNKVYIDGAAITIERSRPNKGNVILKLDGVDSIEQVEALKGKYLQIPQNDSMPLEDDEYYQFQIIGLEVSTTKGRLLGKIDQIFVTGSNDVYVVKGQDGEFLIPAMDDVVKQIDLDNGTMTIEEIEGLL
ncbi:ribosome maturation factor RimM [Chloroflexota bacterium]